MKKFSLVHVFFCALIVVSLQASHFNTVNDVVLLTAIPTQDEHGFSSIVFGDIERFMKAEGAEVVLAKVAYFVRDAKVTTAAGKILRTTDLVNEDLAKKIENRIKLREEHLTNNHASYATKHSAFAGNGLGTGITGSYYNRVADGFSASSHNSFYDHRAASNLATSVVKTSIIPSRSVWEGGNVFIAKNNLGAAKILIGEETLFWTLHALRINGFFKPKDKRSGSPFIVEEGDKVVGSLAKHNDLVNQQWLNDEIASLVAQLGKAQHLNDEQYFEIGKEMEAIGLVRHFNNKLSPELKTIVEEYVGQQEYIKQILWPQEFSVTKDDIIVIPQAAYHLDVFMTLGPKGTIFIQDFPATITYLADLLCYSYEPTSDLNNRDRDIINSYLDSALVLNKDLEPIYEKIHHKLKDAGFTIIKTPGTFYGFDKDKPVHVNFMNALSGWSTKNNRSYYLCLGAHVGPSNKLGNTLMSDFNKFMRKHINEPEVHFIGARDDDFSAAMHFNTSRKSMAGVHCMTYELKKSFAKQ